MSIPKEPRQLMINIMYLVLTALLALNVSAEIFNAFEMVDEGLTSANSALDANNSKQPDAIKESAKKKASLKKYAERVDPIQALSAEASDYLDNIVDELIDASGDANGVKDEGDYVDVQGKRELKGKKNYDGTTRLMVDGGKGKELKEAMLAYKERFLEFVDEEEREAFAASLPIDIDEEAWKLSPNKKKDWSDFTFGHMPLGATMPIFSKFKNDIKSSEAALLNYLSKKVGITSEAVFDKFAVVSAPDKTYIIKGEKFKTDVFLSASAGADSNTGISLSVNGRKLPVNKEGKASFEETASSLGKKKYTVVGTITNPVTGKTDTYKKEYGYEVGQRSVTVSAQKMNVFYVGVENPVAVTAAGVPSEQIKVSMGGAGGASIKRSGGNWVVKATKPTKKGEFAKVNVSAPGLNESRDFRVKRIPSPVPMLGKKRGGAMGTGEFKLYTGIRGELENFDFDAKCTIKGFRFVYAPKRDDPVIVVNPGGKYNGDAQRLVAKAKPGDRFFYENVKCSCPGDGAPREIGSLSVVIK